MLPFALLGLGLALGAGSWLTNAGGKIALLLLCTEAASYLLICSGG